MNRRLVIVIVAILLFLASAVLIYFVSNQSNTNTISSKDAQAVVDLYAQRSLHPAITPGARVHFSEPIDDRYTAFVISGTDYPDYIGIIDTTLAPNQSIIIGPAGRYSPEDLNAMPTQVRAYIVQWEGGEAKE